MFELLPAPVAQPTRHSLAVALRVPWLALASCTLVAGTGFAGGGYFPSSWGWPTLAAGWAAALALLARSEASLSRAGAAAAALLAGLAAWTALGAIWTLNVTQTALAAERTAVYAAALLAALLWARQHPERLLHGVWAAATLLCGWGLTTRLIPDRFGVVDPISGYRLSEPIGYWNSLGLLAAIGALLGLGLATRATSLLGRAVAAASVPVLVATLYFTFSRGAWIALGAGLLAALALDRRRLQLLAVLGALAPLTAIGIWRAAVSSALTTSGSPLPMMAHEGHRLAVVLAAVALGAAALTLGVAWLEPRFALPARTYRLIELGLAAAAAVAVVALLASQGSPVRLAQRAWDGFSTSGPAASANLNSRLLHISGTGRTVLWSVAWRDAKAHPLLGSGGGTFQQVWNRERPVGNTVRNVHNLYLETLAELGPLGLALLLAVLVLPLVAAVRGRDRPLAFAAFGAYIAFVLHVTVDWDWQIASVTLAALLCGAALLAAPGRPLGAAARQVALWGAIALAGVGVYTLASQIPMSRLRSAAAHNDWPAAARDARHASELAPWSEEPWVTLGEADLNAGRLPQARVALLEALAKNPSNWATWLDLARASTGAERAKALARSRALNPLGPEIQ